MRKGGAALACLVCDARAGGDRRAADLGSASTTTAASSSRARSWFYPTMAATGLRLNAITLRWDELAPTAIADQPLIEQAIARAQASGVAVELDIYPLHSQAFTNGAQLRAVDEPGGVRQHARGSSSSRAWAASVARTFPSVREFVVMNECNQPLFVNPQWDTSGQNQSAAVCGRALAAAYDALKGVEQRDPRLGRRPLAARQRQAGRGDELVDDAGHVPRRARHVVQGVREEDGPHRAADGRASTSTRTRCRSRCRSRRATTTSARRASRTCRASTRRSTPRSTARRSGRSASRRAAACRSASTRRASRRTRTAGRGYTGTEISATSAGGVVDQFATEELPGDLVPADARPRRLRPERRASSTSSTWSTRRASRAGRAGCTSPTSRPSSRRRSCATGSRDRRALPGQG